MAITVGDALLKLGVDKSQFQRDVAAAGKHVESRMRKMGAAVRKAGIAFTALGAAGGAGIGLMVKAAADFDKAMREVNTLIGLSEEQMKGMREEVLALSAEMGIDAIESAKALYQAISAGQEPTEALEFLRVAARAAVGGVTDLETATTGLTSIMNAFGLESEQAEHVSDVLFTSMKGGITTIDELSTSFFQAAPIAATLGISFEEVAAAATTITKSGTPTKIAFTSLRQAMVALAKPTTEMQGLLETLGFESGVAAIKALGLQGTFQALATETGATQEEIIRAIGSVEAMQAAFGITGLQAEEFARQFEEVTTQTGVSRVAFEEMADSASFKFNQLKTTIQAFTIEIGDTLLPVITGLADKITSITNSISSWASENKLLAAFVAKLVLGLTFLSATLGPFLIILPGVIKGFALLSKVINLTTIRIVAQKAAFVALKVATIAWRVATLAATVAQWALNVALAASPVGAILLAVTGLVAGITALVFFIKKWTEEEERLNGVALDTVVTLDKMREGFNSVAIAAKDEVDFTIDASKRKLALIQDENVARIAAGNKRRRLDMEYIGWILDKSQEEHDIRVQALLDTLEWKRTHYLPELKAGLELERQAGESFNDWFKRNNADLIEKGEERIQADRDALDERIEMGNFWADFKKTLDDAEVEAFAAKVFAIGDLESRANKIRLADLEHMNELRIKLLEEEEAAALRLKKVKEGLAIEERARLNALLASMAPEGGVFGREIAEREELRAKDDLTAVEERRLRHLDDLLNAYDARLALAEGARESEAEARLAGRDQPRFGAVPPGFVPGGDMPPGFGIFDPTMNEIATEINRLLDRLEKTGSLADSERAYLQSGGFNTANIIFEVDGVKMAEVIGQPLVDVIRVRQGGAVD